MPELPEVETVRRILERAAVGRTITGVRCARPKLVEALADGLALEHLVGARVERVGRRAKYLTLRFDRDPQAVLHLRMTGQVAAVAPDGARQVAGHPVPAYDAPLPAPTTHLTLDLDDGTTIYLQDPRHFARLTLLPAAELDAYLAGRDLGPEPSDPALTPDALAEKLRARGRAKLKPLLLDQAFVSGLGNIYADEALHLARLHPERKAGSLSRSEVERLHQAMRAVLKEAIEIGGARIYHGKAAPINGFPRVHARAGEPCPDCGATVVKYTLAGRGTYYCPTCQPKPSAT
ncbi:MAG TPA: bifunctional DNA-formamidopyrimidine glycosylase/DNA-(apurinic or apyrimidinic site) lyase [Thermomicrobiales bacterium]|nr:bifunctional DNA-formamidopyrimidine glycosylase/DNA-(apurinic or apyrimidinic site) lyase [Thermomicrobiales bacterium]